MSGRDDRLKVWWVSLGWAPLISHTIQGALSKRGPHFWLAVVFKIQPLQACNSRFLILMHQPKSQLLLVAGYLATTPCSCGSRPILWGGGIQQDPTLFIYHECLHAFLPEMTDYAVWFHDTLLKPIFSAFKGIISLKKKKKKGSPRLC